MVKITSLTTPDVKNPMPDNTFFWQEDKTDHLALILPGLNYTCDMPLLYYSAQFLVAEGADVLQVKYDYTQNSQGKPVPPCQPAGRWWSNWCACWSRFSVRMPGPGADVDTPPNTSTPQAGCRTEVNICEEAPLTKCVSSSAAFGATSEVATAWMNRSSDAMWSSVTLS